MEQTWSLVTISTMEEASKGWLCMYQIGSTSELSGWGGFTLPQGNKITCYKILGTTSE